jgi:hypothetical protein
VGLGTERIGDSNGIFALPRRPHAVGESRWGAQGGQPRDGRRSKAGGTTVTVAHGTVTVSARPTESWASLSASPSSRARASAAHPPGALWRLFGAPQLFSCAFSSLSTYI